MKKELLTFKDPKSPVSETFRTLRTNIQFMNTNRKMKTLLVTSTFPEEGKSWITSNLAVTFAQAGKKVVLIDADMRKGRQYNIFDILPKPGLSNYLSNIDSNNNETDNVRVTNYIQETEIDNLHVLVAGNIPPNPSELLVSSRMRDLLEELKNMCDLIIIDGTPCELVSDSIILSRFVDSTIIVTAQKETKKDALERIIKNIQNVGGKIAGVVVNKVDMSKKKYNQSYYFNSISANGSSKKSKHIRTKDDEINMLFRSMNNNVEQSVYNNNEDIKNNNQNNYNNKNVSTPEEIYQKVIDVESSMKKQNKEINSDFDFSDSSKDVLTNTNIEKADSAKDMSDDKTNQIINLVNNYIEEEKHKQERKN